MRQKIIALIHLLTFIWAFQSDSLGQSTWIIPRISEEIAFDGIPNESAWSSAIPFPMITHLPISGNSPGEESDVRVVYDDSYLYVGGKLYYEDPGLVQAIGKKRDLMSMTCDWLGISLDTYNDKENALLFFTNPNGLRWDAAVRNDGTPSSFSMPLNMNWNTFWEVKTSMDDQGWYVEMRIPVSSLRFQPKDDKIVMGLSIFRWLPSKNEGYTYPMIPLDWGETSNLKPSQYAEVEFEQLNPKKPLYISPYVLTAFEQTHKINDAETGYDYTGGPRFNPGIDIKYGINPNTTLDLTANTDFAQVEADDQQINLTRFSLFFPEKRMFFLERSSIFDFELGGNSNLFYSRRIGLHDDHPVRIYGGARLNSRVNDWDIGLLNMQTASFDDLPSENFGVFRFKKRVFNEYSYAGGMLTSRLGVDGSYNLAYGIDGVIRLFGDDYLTVRIAQTFSNVAANQPLSLDPTKLRAHWERRRREGFSYEFSGSYSGKEFDPGIGFEIFDDYWSTREDFVYTWISPDKAKLQSHSINLQNFHLNSVYDNSFLIYSLGPTWKFAMKKNWGGSITLGYWYEYLDEDFEIVDPVVVPAEKYQFLNTTLMLNTPGSKTIYAIFMMEAGGYYDGMKISPSIQPTWNIGTSMELGGMYQFDYVSFPERNQSLRNHIAGLRALYMFSTKLSLSAFIQYNTAIDKVLSNIRFRYNPREGTDLYLVFNEGRNTWLEREVPNLPIYNQRNVTLKFTYTFELQR